MILYPHSTPIILTDDIYADYGGNPANSTLIQRRAAYRLAEMAVTDDIDTFLLPTIVTGTYHFSPRIALDNTYIRKVILTQFLDESESVYHSISGSANWEVSRWNDDYGLLDIDCRCYPCCCGTLQYPYQVKVVYEAGLPTGTANQPDFLLALTTYANIILNEIVGYGNEAPGDIGIQYYSNQDYKESRKPLLRTVYGSSPKANFAHKLLTRYRKYRTVGL